MNTRGLLAALSLGGAIIGTRVLAGPAVDQPPVSFPDASIDRAICTHGEGAAPRQGRQKPAGAGLQVVETSAPAQPCPR
jgi:hypothetical protein